MKTKSVINAQLFRFFLLSVALMVAFSCKPPDLHDLLKKGDNVSLEKALKKGANVNVKNENGRTVLAEAILHADTSAVSLILKYDSALLKSGAVEYAASTVCPVDSVNKWSDHDLDYPSIKILRQIMEAAKAREFKWKKMDLVGSLEIKMEMGEFDRQSGTPTFYQSLVLNTADKAYELNIARKETRFVNIKKSAATGNWNVSLIPGGKYQVKGFLTGDGIIEVSYLAFDESSENNGSMTFALRNFTWSTKQILDTLIQKWTKSK